MVRLNTCIAHGFPERLWLLGGDVGFPNGRRLMDDVVAIELWAIAGATYPLGNKSYTADAPAILVAGRPSGLSRC